MSLTREQMIEMLQSELARRKRVNALPQSLENIKNDEERTSAAFDDENANFAANLVGGANRAVRGTLNLLTKRPQLGQPQPKFWSDETLREIDKRDKNLNETTGGFLGGLVGSTAATLPLAKGTGAVVDNGGRLVKALSSPYVRNAAEGAVTSAVMADPDQQGEAGLEGAAWGVGATGVGKFLKRTLGGLVEKGAAATDLQTLGKSESKDLFVPLSQATQRGPNEPKANFFTRSIGGMYRGLLPYFPGTTGQIERQAGRLVSDVEEMAIRQVDQALDPAGVGRLRHDALKEPQRAVKELGDMITDSYKNTVKSYSFHVPSDMEAQVRARILQARPDVPPAIADEYTEEFMTLLKRYSDKSGTVTGNNLMDVKNLFGKKPRDLAPTPNDKMMVDSMHDLIDDLVEDQLRYGNKASNLTDLAEYKRTRDAWGKFSTLRDAVGGKRAQRVEGHFTPGELVDTAGNNLQQRELGQAAHGVTSTPAISVNAEGRNIGRISGALGTGAMMGTAGFLPGALTAGAVIGGANVAATETAQKLLMGDTKTQRFIINALRNDPELAAQVGQILRTTMTTKQGSDYRGEE